MNKSKLRKNYLTRQESLSDAQRRERSLQISVRYFTDFDLADVRFLHLFLSIAERNEVDTSFITNDLWGEHISIKTVVPRVDFDNDCLEHLEFNSETTLLVNDWGIPEPVGNELIDEKKIDVVLVPLLCFDECGYRVGYGKGFYDKFLSKCRPDCLKIGLGYFEPIKEIEDIQDFDIRLDSCVTPKKVWKFTRS